MGNQAVVLDGLARDSHYALQCLNHLVLLHDVNLCNSQSQARYLIFTLDGTALVTCSWSQGLPHVPAVVGILGFLICLMFGHWKGVDRSQWAHEGAGIWSSPRHAQG